MHRFPPFHSCRCQTSICASSDLAKVATLQQGIWFLPSRPSLPPPFMYRRNPCLPCQNHHFSVWHLCYQFDIPNQQDEPLVVQAWQQKLTAADVSPVFKSLSSLALDLRIEEPRASEQPCWCKTANSAHLPWQGKPCWGEQTWQCEGSKRSKGPYTCTAPLPLEPTRGVIFPMPILGQYRN
jgi:hypothetical protein